MALTAGGVGRGAGVSLAGVAGTDAGDEVPFVALPFTPFVAWCLSSSLSSPVSLFLTRWRTEGESQWRLSHCEKG